MTGDWILDHAEWVAAAAIVAIAGVIFGLALSGAFDENCPAGQSSQFAYFYPMITTVNNVTTTTLIPVYTCQESR